MGGGINGIWYIDFPLPAFPTPPSASPVFGSDPIFGKSQIELSFNGNMYASSPFVSSALKNIGAFNPAAFPPSMNLLPTGPSFTIGSTGVDAPKASYNFAGFPQSDLYTLPDQIDGENYGSITSAPVTQLATVNTFTYPTSSPILSPWSASNNPWSTSGPVQVINELRISGNSNLKIDGMTFQFSPDAKVIIEEGNSLILDGNTLTSDHSADPCFLYTWTGVEVWGNTSASQFSANAQGKLTLINGSHIEYAKSKARASKPGSLITTGEGGIIIAKSSDFKNNNIDIEFNPYQNYLLMPQAIMLFVCIANPDATKNDTFLKYLQYDIPNPLPQYMIDMIMALWDNGTARTTMESMLANYSSVMATTSDKLLADLYFKTYSDNDSIVSIENDTINYNDTNRY